MNESEVMNGKNNETVADIIGEMRTLYQGCEDCYLNEMTCGDLLDIIKRIEAAHKRENSKLRKCLYDALTQAWGMILEATKGAKQ